MRGNLTVHSATAIALGLPGTGNQINACSTTAGDNSCNNFAIVAIISHGANGSGAFLPQSGNRKPLPAGANELENTDSDTAFTQMAFMDDTAAPGGIYDDLVLWLPPAEFTMPLQARGIIPSAQGLLNQRIAKIEGVLLNEIILDRFNDPDGPPAPPLCDCGVDCNAIVTTPANYAGCFRSAGHRVPFVDTNNDGLAENDKVVGYVPYGDFVGLTQQDALDPWGQWIRYETLYCVSGHSFLCPNLSRNVGVYSSSPDAQAYKLTSLGLDGVVGGDDIVYDRATADLVGTMAGARVPVD
jgi:hypothetical protein